MPWRMGPYQPEPLGIEQSIQASIEIPHLQLTYAPGDVVSGVVKRICHDKETSSQPLTASIDLIVRAVTQIARREGSSENRRWVRYVGDKTLYHSRNNTVFSGPGQYGINSWPFNLTIPLSAFTAPPPQMFGTPPPPHALPPSFYRNADEEIQPMKLRRRVIYVEYYLESQIVGGDGKPSFARFPLFVRPRSSTLPISLLSPLQKTSKAQVIKTHHLHPDQKGKQLSMRQRMSTVFQRDQLPRYTFYAEVMFNKTIQLGHPAPLSFKMRILPDRSLNTSDIFVVPGAEELPPVTLVSFLLQLRTTTCVERLEGKVAQVQELTQSKMASRQLMVWHQSEGDKAEKPENADGPDAPLRLELPNDGSGDDWLDLGSLLHHSVHASGVWTSPSHDGEKSKGQLAPEFAPFDWLAYPSFNSSPNVRHLHAMRWQMTLECGGKRVKIEDSSDVELVGPSESDEMKHAEGLGPEGIAAAHRAWTELKVPSPVQFFGARGDGIATAGGSGAEGGRGEKAAYQLQQQQQRLWQSPPSDDDNYDDDEPPPGYDDVMGEKPGINLTGKEKQ